MIKGSVALPLWQSSRIVWLCLESLCRQQKPKNGWELVVFEELNIRMSGEAFIRSYSDRLRKVGCERITYMTQEEKITLSEKWVHIARATSDTSEYYILCAADNYYSPFMLREAESLIKDNDWIVQTKGFFYSFQFDKVIFYDYLAAIGLQMYARTELVRDFPLVKMESGIDSWFGRQMKDRRICITGGQNWRYTLCTDGLNNISKGRYRYFEKVTLPFKETATRLEDIVPKDIYRKIKSLCLQLQLSSPLGQSADGLTMQ